MGQPEARLQRNIQNKLREKYGSKCFIFKIHGGPLMMAGLPDLIACIHGVFIAIEVKMPERRDNVSEIQERVHGRMRRAGASVLVASSVKEAIDKTDQIVKGNDESQ